MSKMRVGLVLGGGGARAAYQIGVLRALGELSVEVAAVSAVGVGAINGAIVASSRDPADASRTLERLWREAVLSPGSRATLGPFPILRLGLYSDLVFSSGVTPTLNERARNVSRVAKATHAHRVAMRGNSGTGDMLIDLALGAIEELLDVETDSELDRQFAKGLDDALETLAMPFHVAVQERHEGMLETLQLALQGVGVLSPRPPRYIDLSAEPDPAVRRAYLLGSAALPFWGQAEQIEDAALGDASFGGRGMSAGAVPVRPLLRDWEALALDAIVVVHTTPGVAWYPAWEGAPSPIELRPSESDGGATFWSATGDQVAALARLGARDASRRLLRIFDDLDAWRRADTARENLRNAARGWGDDLLPPAVPDPGEE